MRTLLLLLCLCLPALAAEPERAPEHAPDSFPVTIQPKDFETLVNYLASEPYARVAPIIGLLSRAAEASRPPPKPVESPPVPK